MTPYDTLLFEVADGVAAPEQLIAHCQAELAYCHAPVAADLLAELPKGPTGKILRRELRADARGAAAPVNP